MQLFPRLTTLVLDEQFFCRHWLPEEDGGFAADEKTCVTDMLPQTVTLFGVRLHHMFLAWNDIRHLGDEVSAGRFPALRRVDIQVLLHPDADRYKSDLDGKLTERFEKYREGARRAFGATHVKARVRKVREGKFASGDEY